jgi:anti-sigma factor RsiW
MAQLNEEDRVELVAYLDGELTEEATQAFEARLNRDCQLRTEVEAMKKTWDLLDYLPKTEPSPSFTHRTLERVALKSGAKIAGGSPKRWAWLAPVGWAAAMLVAMLGGLLIANWFWPAPSPVQTNAQLELEEQIARDQEVIRHIKLYGNAPNLAFVKALPQAFDDEEDE